MKTLILTHEDVKSLLNMKDTIEDVEEAYKSFNSGEVTQPPIMSIILPELNSETDVKASYSAATGMICIKSAPGFWDNMKKYNLPTLFATINLFDGTNGFPLCIMEATLITGIRTGAAGGVSVKALARKDSRIVGVIGAGTQARMQVRAIKQVLPITTVKVWSQFPSELDSYKKDIEGELGVEVIPCDSAQKAVVGSDIIVTATPGKEPFVKNEWVKPGTHICAIGADFEGKQELDVKLFARAKIVVDSIKQCTTGGETLNPIKAGIITADDIHAEIGEVLLGKKAGRTNDEEITIFDTTGMSVQDNATATGIYKRALERSIGQSINFV